MNKEILYYKIRKSKNPIRGTERSCGIDFFIPSYDNEFINDLVNKNDNTDEKNYIIDYDLLKDKFYIIIKKGGNILIPLGYKIILPENTTFIAFNKSSIAFKKGLVLGAAVVDEDYRGEIHGNFLNPTSRDIKIYFDEKIIQFVLIPVIYANIRNIDLKEFKIYENTERGEGGFGSTDNKEKNNV